MGQSISKETIDRLLVFQENEITEYHIYNNLSKMVKDQGNKELLQRIARDEMAHYDFYSKYTQREVKPNRWRVFLYTWIARIFGLTFGLKLMEAGESRAHSDYSEAAKEIPEVSRIAEEEDKHEHELLDLIEEDRLNYISSIVLGLNDALVELTGTLAGLTFALQNTRLIALAGLITGVAASFSMGASEYLSTKTEGDSADNALKSAFYTWMAYIFTVVVLILPYLLISNYFVSLPVMLLAGILIILVFNFYVSVVKDLPFRKRFLEMAAISLGVAALSFGIGYVIRAFLGVDV